MSRDPEGMEAVGGGDAGTDKAAVLRLLQDGAAPAARALCERLCRQAPDDGECWYMMGDALAACGGFEAAVPCYEKGLHLAPRHPGADRLAGQGQQLLQRLPAAAAADLFEALCRACPDDVRAWFLASSAAGRRGDMHAAVEYARRALALDRDHTSAAMNLAKALAALGRQAEAVPWYRRLLQRYPDVAELHAGLGAALIDTRDYAGADHHLGRALALTSTTPFVQGELGRLRFAQGRLDEAQQHYRELIDMQPRHAGAHANLAAVLYAAGRPASAIETLRAAIALDPHAASAWDRLAYALMETHQLEEAAAVIQQALAMAPEDVTLHFTCAQIYHAQGRMRDALAAATQVTVMDPDHAGAEASRFMAMQLLPEYTDQDIYAATCRWAARHAPTGPFRPFSNAPDPRRRLRIGYVSGDLREHPVGYYMEALLSRHRRSAFEITCYYNHTREDGVTRRLQGLADRWVNISDLSDEDAAGTIRDAGIDVLVDLSGHTGQNRLPVFARRPAPVQLTWMGYFDTTGVEAMDYILADRYVIPAEQERYYVERVMRLPGCYMIFSPPSYALPVQPPPAVEAGCITFGCCNRAGKLNEPLAAVWAKILRQVPGSRLLLRNTAYGDIGVVRRCTAMFEAHGIAPERLLFGGFAPREELLATYHQIDVALDPFPYNGGLTTFEALWMGVPVIALRGRRFVGRVGDSVLSNAGVPQWVADTEEDYVALACALAADPAGLAGIRAALRGRVEASPLCDATGFTAAAEAAYRTMWSEWCSTERGDERQS